MNRQKHKLSRRILAVLLMAAMLITMLPSAMFAAPSDGSGEPAGQTESLGGEKTENNITVSKTAVRSQEAPDTWDVTLTVTPNEQDIKPVPLEVVLVLDTSISMNDTLSGRTTRMDALKNVLTEKDGLIDTLANAGAKVGIVTFNNSATKENRGNFYDLSQDGVAKALKDAINDDGRNSMLSTAIYTNIKDGLSKASDFFSESDSNQTNRAVIVLSDGACQISNINRGQAINPDAQRGEEKEYMDGLKYEANNIKTNLNAELYGISFASGQNSDGYKTLAKIVDAENLKNSMTAGELASAFETIVNEILAMVVDPMGPYVELDGQATATVTENGRPVSGFPGVTGSSTLYWTPDKPLEAGQTLTIEYTVKLKDDASELWKKANNGDLTVALNGNAVLSYELTNGQEMDPIPFPVPTDTVEIAKLSVSNEVDGEAAEDNYDDQYALVYNGEFWQKDRGSYTTQPFTWVNPAETVNGVKYSGSSTLTVPGAEAVDVKESDFSQKLTPVTGGEYKLVHEYNFVQKDSLTLEIYVDGSIEPVTIENESDLNKYISNLGADVNGETEEVGLTFNEGNVTVSYEYEQYNSADLQFKVNDDYVLQAVDGEFIIGKNSWKGVDSNEGNVRVDNVAGDSTLKIYLNTPYTVSYLPTKLE